MKTLITLAATVTMLMAFSTAAIFAAEPTGEFVFKDNQAYDQKNLVGALSSTIIQNGQFVGSGDNSYNIDQTNAPGSRATEVQALQALQGRGRDK